MFLLGKDTIREAKNRIGKKIVLKKESKRQKLTNIGNLIILEVHLLPPKLTTIVIVAYSESDTQHSKTTRFKSFLRLHFEQKRSKVQSIERRKAWCQ